ncbi:MAG: hypothetical protein SGILL_007868 [Bacillariaceae sp.]
MKFSKALVTATFSSLVLTEAADQRRLRGQGGSRVMSAECDLDMFWETSLPSEESDLFNLPSVREGETDSIITFLTDEIGSFKDEKIASFIGSLLLPTVVAAGAEEDVTVLGEEAGVSACESLDFLGDTDVLVFGYEHTGIALCAAINPCSHTYAVGQEGVIQPIQIVPGLLSFTPKAIGFSLHKELQATSLNKMWDGNGPAEQIEVNGHLILKGAGNLGFTPTSKIDVSVELDTSLLIDADVNNNGLIPPLDSADVSLDHFDYAMLLSGSTTAKVTLAGIELDFSALMRRDADLYAVVNGADTQMQFAASWTLSLGGFCQISKLMGFICEIFDADADLTGAVRGFVSEDGVGIQLSVDVSLALKAFEDPVLKEIIPIPDAAFEGGADISVSFDGDGIQVGACARNGESQVCIQQCAKDSHCNGDSYCSFLGMCLPKVAQDYVCVEDKACLSGKCAAGFCSECKGSDDCFDNKYCTTPFLVTGKPGLVCNPREEDGHICVTSDMCASRSCNYWYSRAHYACGEEPKWENGSICAEGTTCNACKNKASYWYGKAITACGQEPKWDDGTTCAEGTTCYACGNKASYWYGKAITACGPEPKWHDGTTCAMGTTCNACQNPATYWPGKVITACGNEPCWGKGTTCGSGTTCNTCCGTAHCPWYQFGICTCN